MGAGSIARLFSCNGDRGPKDCEYLNCVKLLYCSHRASSKFNVVFPLLDTQLLVIPFSSENIVERNLPTYGMHQCLAWLFIKARKTAAFMAD